MFCQNCGSQIPDGTAYCPTCGAPTGQQPRPPQPPKKNNTALIAVIALAAVLLIAVIVLVVVLVTRDTDSSGSGRDKTKTEDKDTGDDTDAGDAGDSKTGSSEAGSVAEAMAVSWFTGDVDAMVDLLPGELIEVMEDSGITLYGDLYESESDLLDLFRDVCRQLRDDFLNGVILSKSDIKISNLEKDRNGTSYLKDDVIDLYADEYDITVKDFAVYVGTLTATVDGQRGSADFYVPLIKIGSKWYADFFNLNDVLWEPFI